MKENRERLQNPKAPAVIATHTAGRPGAGRRGNTNPAEKNRLKIAAYTAAQNNMPMRWTPCDNWSAAFSFGSGVGQRNLCYALLL